MFESQKKGFKSYYVQSGFYDFKTKSQVTFFKVKSKSHKSLTFFGLWVRDQTKLAMFLLSFKISVDSGKK